MRKFKRFIMNIVRTPGALYRFWKNRKDRGFYR